MNNPAARFNTILLMGAHVEACEPDVPPLTDSDVCARLNEKFDVLRPDGALSISNSHSLDDVAVMPLAKPEILTSSPLMSLEKLALANAAMSVLSNLSSYSEALKAFDVLSEKADVDEGGHWEQYSEDDYDDITVFSPYVEKSPDELAVFILEIADDNLFIYRTILAQAENGMLKAINDSGTFPGLALCHDALADIK